MVFEKPVEECFEYAALHGFRHLEIDLVKKHSLVKTFTPSRIRQIRELCVLHNVELSLHPPYYMNFSAWFPLMRKAHFSQLRKSIRLAHQLGARHVTIHMGSFSRTTLWANQRRIALGRVLKGLHSILKLCEHHGIILALENVIPLRLESGFFFLGDNIKDLEYMFSRLDSPYLKWCLDTGHANCSEGVPAYIEALGGRLAAVHVHDNHGGYDEHLTVGEGTIPWAKVAQALKAIDYHGPYISECFHTTPHEAKRHMARYL